MSELRLRRALEGRPGFEGLLVPWDTPATVTDRDYTYRESWAAGSISAEGRVPVYDGHNPVTLERGALIGALEGLESRADGLYGTVHLSRSGRAAEVRELAEMFDVGLSVEVVADDADAAEVDGVLVRSRGVLTGLAVLLPPTTAAYPAARVTVLRAKETATMPTATDTPPAPVEPPAEPPAEPTPDDTAMLERLEPAMRAAVESEVARLRLSAPTPGHPAHPLARFRTFGDYAHAALRERSLFRALADQITTDNPGVMPPGWLSEVFGILDKSSPLMAALRRPAPPEGLDVNWPYFDGDLFALVGVQAVEKTPITSVKVSIKRGTNALETYAGGSDISYQLLTRSDPSYLDAYVRIMTAAYAAVTGAALGAALDAASATDVTLDPATADVDAAAAAVFEASLKVAQATGTPATIIGAGADMFLALGKAALYTTAGDSAGAASASSLSVNYAGLTIAYDPTLPPAIAIATNKTAAAWFADGPFVINAEDVEKLGRDVAVWGLGTPGVMSAAGVARIAATPPVAGRSSRSSKSDG